MTVYVPSHNYGRYLQQCLDSVFKQLYTNWELIIVDEGSSDQTSVLAQAACLRDPDRVTLLSFPTRIGLQKVANRVLRLAKGKYMMRLDADDWLDESALLVMVNKLESLPNAGVVYGNYYYVDEGGTVIGMERRPALGTEDMSGHLPPHGACTLFRVRAMRAAGGYLENVRAQDGWDLWFKLYKRVGATSVNVPVFYYRQHASSLSRDHARLLQARTAILRTAGEKLQGDYPLNSVAIIPAKESYPGQEGIPFREVEGASLLERAITEASGVPEVTAVVVSSSSEAVIAYSQELELSGTVPPHHRLLKSDSTTSRGLPLLALMREGSEAFAKATGQKPDIVSFLSLHAFRRRAIHIEKALSLLRLTESDSVVSVLEEPDPMFRHGPEGLVLMNPGRLAGLTFERERHYRFNGAIVATWAEILETGSPFGERIGYIEMSPSDSLQYRGDIVLGR
ncbi:MAG: glycosyltransferase [Rhodothermales bacterium]|nr:glycosyltransferase [Rhodothermales bacterium]MBO6781027.1 glycosyltransferase [Rhodothermales bacterium]